MFWRGRGIEGWSLAAAHISVQSELRDREYAAAHVLQAAVHLSVDIFEDAQAGDFLGEICGVGFGVFVPHA